MPTIRQPMKAGLASLLLPVAGDFPRSIDA
jgi:hypothetical protein